MTHEQLVAAILAARPGSHWNLRGTTYESLEWLDAPETKPTAAELGL